ncbi:MAG: putative CvpA family protein [Rickettsiaceae bacterium]|jgi:uncharacterized membrane protein required for colicin V production|nr:putative CvpA family protein [Rickettsiaceae bacterium]
MYLANIIGGLVAAFFLWRGYRRGFSASLIHYFNCLVAYVISVLFIAPLSDVMTKYLHLEGLIVYFIAGILIFSASLVTLNFVINKTLEIVLEQIPETEFTADMSRIGGTIIGLIAGCFIGLLVVYAVNLSQETDTKSLAAQVKSPDNKPDGKFTKEGVYTYQANGLKKRQSKADSSETASTNFIDLASRKMVSTILAATVKFSFQNQTITQLTKTISANPQAASQSINQLANSKETANLFSNPEIQNLLNKGSSKLLLNNKSFREFIDSKQVRTIVGYSGNAQTSTTYEEIATDAVIMAWKRFETIRQNPRATEIISDEKFIKKLESSNTLQLLIDRQLKELFDIMIGKENKNA